jgi:hypothetical protein
MALTLLAVCGLSFMTRVKRPRKPKGIRTARRAVKKKH